MHIEVTDDGSQTLRAVSGDTYHSMRGAVGESLHVFIGAGMDYAAGHGTAGVGRPLRILEAGFGSGLNAWLTMKHAMECGLSVEYRALELYPVGEEVALMDYAADDAFMELHRAPWNEAYRVNESFSIEKLQADIAEVEPGKDFDVVYFDAFAPDVQPQLWSVEVFVRFRMSLREGGVLVTYSAKGDVKRNLRAAGFHVERLAGALGKRHMLRAINRH